MADILIQQYNNAVLDIGLGNIEPATDVFKIMLINAYTFNAAHNEYADVSSYEIDAEGGYTLGGFTIDNTDWVAGTGVTRLTADNFTFTASDVVPTFNAAIIYSDTSSGKKLLVHLGLGEDVNLTVSDQLFIPIGDGILKFMAA